MLLCILCLFGGTVSTAFPPAAAETLAPVPDLMVNNEWIVFSVGDIPTRGAPVGTQSVNITVFVYDKGIDNITSVNVTLDINGTRLGVMPAVNFSDGPLVTMAAYFAWDTGTLPAGVYSVRAQANDSAGDADPADNVAETNFTLAARPPTLTLELDPVAAEANVTQTAPGMVDLTGNMTISDLCGQNVDWEIKSSVDDKWFSRGSESYYNWGELRRRFHADILVPAATRADRPMTVLITASAQILEANITVSELAIVMVRPYFRFTLDSDFPYREISPGNQAFFSFKLTNIGNAVDSFELKISNLDDLVGKGWKVKLSTNNLSKVQPGDFAPFRITARSPEEWTLWKSEPTGMTVQVASQGARDQKQVVTLRYPVYAYEKGSNPTWYNWTTIELSIVILAVAGVAGFWMWRTKKRKAVDIKTGPEVKT